RVKHSSRPEWSIGEIVDTTIDGKVKVYFHIGGFRTLSIGGAKLEIVNAAEVIAPLEISLKLTVSVDEAKRMISQIPHSTCTDAASQRWHVAADGTVQDESVNWLFCWAKTGMGSPTAAEAARKVFDAILPITFDQYGAMVDHEY